jgi:hypothetical protein
MERKGKKFTGRDFPKRKKFPQRECPVEVFASSPSVKRDALYEIQFNFSEIILRFPTDEFPGSFYNASYV